MKVCIYSFIFMFSVSISQASVLVRTYSQVPCEHWSYEGTCQFKGFRRQAPDARSLQQVLDRLNYKIETLERKVNFLEKENSDLLLERSEKF